MFFPGVVQPCPGKASWKTRTGTLFFRAVGSVRGGALKMAGEFLYPHPDPVDPAPEYTVFVVSHLA